MSEQAWVGGAVVGPAPGRSGWSPFEAGGIGASVVAVLDQARSRHGGQPGAAFPAAVGATDRELARFGRGDDPGEVLRATRLTAVARAGRF